MRHVGMIMIAGRHIENIESDFNMIEIKAFLKDYFFFEIRKMSRAGRNRKGSK
jgi:hypothetical protein